MPPKYASKASAKVRNFLPSNLGNELRRSERAPTAWGMRLRRKDESLSPASVTMLLLTLRT
eukprot:12217532-Alexandrium_andersonii.AAC.1